MRVQVSKLATQSSAVTRLGVVSGAGFGKSGRFGTTANPPAKVRFPV